ncbi:cystatin-F [Anarhichas minor]|uniref:cystatin-F n=1 Tax=Anarhichas minor TaxID=65739 RepID=UPI003F73C4A9
MMGLKTLLLVSLLAALELMLAAGSHHGRSMPGSPVNISRKDRGLRQVVLSAAHFFNNQSNDAFLFRPSAVHRAQRQIVKGIRYLVDLEISRTVCRKRDNNNNLSNCDFQPVGRLHQMFQCHTEVWVVPWQNQTRTLLFHCRP